MLSEPIRESRIEVRDENLKYLGYVYVYGPPWPSSVMLLDEPTPRSQPPEELPAWVDLGEPLVLTVRTIWDEDGVGKVCYLVDSHNFYRLERARGFFPV